MLGDCTDHRVRLYSQLRSRTHQSLPTLCSGFASITLWPQLGDRSSQVHMNCTLIQLRGDFNFLDLATRLILHLPASSGTTSIQCTWRCISASKFLCGFFFLDHGTTCLHDLLRGSGTKWAHFTLRWICLFFERLYFEKSKVGRLHQERNIFSQEHHVLFGQLASLVSMVVDCLPKYCHNYSSDFSCWSETSSLIGRRSSRCYVASQYMELGI